jgi:hypothetical protein
VRKAAPKLTDADGDADEDGSLRRVNHGNLPTPPSDGEDGARSSFAPPLYTRAQGESPVRKPKWSQLTRLDDEDIVSAFDEPKDYDVEDTLGTTSGIDSLGLQGFGSSWNQGGASLSGGLPQYEVKRKTPSPELPVVEIPIEESQLDDID